MSAPSVAAPVYKGKVTHRSWAQLPEELIRIIATYHIWDLSVSGYCPETWQARPFWQNMMVFTTVRNALEVDKFMGICPQWSAAMETHTFWQHAIALIDPHDSLGIHAYVRNNNSSAPPVRLSPYRHFRYILACSCLVCRINSPNTTHGLATAKRTILTNYLGACGLCRDHDRQKGAFCGLCLREAQPYDVEPTANSILNSGCMENEDEEQWPGVEATCRNCRAEGLWRRVCHTDDREAVGGRKFRSDDWEARSSIEGFIDLAEGTISDVVSLAKERYWIRSHTKLSDMLSQALAANRFDGREERYMSGVDDLEMELSDAEDDDEEDVELAQLTEDSGVRDLALGDWARNRILDGFWISPADQWYGSVNLGQPWDTKAVHPCPWTVEDEDVDRSREADEVPEVEEEHPRRATVREEIPPSYTMCENTYHAHQKQMRVLLLPAMKNIVRRLVIECGADSIDPAMRAARMTLEDVMAELRDEATWFDGVDWLERRRNVRREADRHARQGGSDDHASTSSRSSKSSDESSTMTSPVLSTSTFQTTPSPPPLEDKKQENTVQSQTQMPPPLSRPVTIAVAPVLDPPRLIHPIPHVPVTTTHLPHFSLEAFKAVWREACAPLYHCRCKICERAMARANDAAAALSAQLANPNPQPWVAEANCEAEREAEKTEQQQHQQQQHEVMEIKLDEANDADGEGEEEVEYAEYDDEDDEDFDSEGGNDGSRSGSRSLSPPRLRRAVYTPPLTISPRKRSCDEIDDERVSGTRGGDLEEDDTPLRRSYAQLSPGTPPKRTRREGPAVVQGLMIDPQERMTHKRSSEELYALDNDNPTGGDALEDGLRAKRVKVSEEAESPPTSLTAEDSEHSTPDEYEDVRKRPKVLER